MKFCVHLHLRAPASINWPSNLNMSTSAKVSKHIRTPSLQLAALTRGAFIVCVVLIACIWGVVAIDLRHEREMHVAQAERDTTNLGIAFQSQVESTLNTVDAVLLTLRHEVMETRPVVGPHEILGWVRQGPLKDAIMQVAVIDAQGYLVYTSANPSIKPVFVGDRDHFKAHVGATDDKLYVSKTIRTRTSDVDAIPFSRRISGADGSFQGVVSVLLRAEHFSGFYESMQIGSHGAVTLVRDGTVLARSSRQALSSSPVGMDVSAELPGPGLMAVTRFMRNPLDGMVRMVHARRLKDQPLAVVVSMTEQDYLAEYRGTVMTQLVVAATVSCGLVALTLVLIFLARRLDATRLEGATSERRLRDIVENTNVVTWELDLATWCFTYVSPQVVAMFGYPAEDWFSEDFWPAHLHPQDRRQATAFCTAQTGLGQDHAFEYRFMKQDGSVAWVRDIVKVLQGNNGEPGRLSGVMIDVTREKEVAAELAKQHVLVRALIDSVPDLIFFKDVNSVYLGCNAAFAAFAGRSEREQVGKTDFAFFDHETAQAFRAKDQEMLESGQSRSNEEWVSYPDGRKVLLDTLKTPLTDANGQVQGIVGISRDITERKRAEEGLLVANAFIEATHEGIMVTDSNAKILSVNPAFTTITGWSAHEVLGKKPGVLKSGRHPPDFYVELWRILRADGYWEGEIWNRKKSGETYVQWISINAIVDASQAVTRYVGVLSDITQRKNHEEKITQQANFDALTGLANRNLFADRLERAITGARRKQWQVGLMFIDLDRFKWINDTLGHDAGDTLLVEAAMRLKACVREEDTVARLGGDEFAIVIEGLAGQEPLQNVAEKILAALADAFVLDGAPRYISGSVGVTIFPSDADTASDLLRNADIAMYQAKASGRNCSRFYSADMQADAVRRVQVEHELRQALDRGGLVLHYQPMVDTHTRQVMGVEALLRWLHPTRGLLLPAEFLAVAEDCGLSNALGDWVFDEACRHWRARVDAGHAPLQTSINVSTMQARHADLRDGIVRALTRHEVPASMIALELTEAVVFGQGTEPRHSLGNLAGLGLHFSLDDFGTDYSSLTGLQCFPFDTVKIDSSIIASLPNNASGKQMVQAIVSMAHGLNLKVVAEGVENDGQLDFLQALGCDLVQGYLIGLPMPVPQFEDFASRHAARLAQSGR